MNRRTAASTIWIAFGIMALLLWVEGVKRISKQLFDLEAAIRLQTAQQTYLIERHRANK